MNTHGAVVVTGASTGIGRATALYLDEKGFRVFAGVRREEDAAALRKAGSERLSPVFIDVTDGDSLATAAQAIGAALGDEGLQGLVNNAGIGVGAPLEFLELAELRRQLEVNVVGPVAAIQTFLPLIRKRRGRIVNVGSIGGRIAQPLLGPYNASKFALEALSDAQRMELKPWGIHVSLVEPGAIATAIWGKTQAYAETTVAQLPPRARQLYGAAFDAVLGTAMKLSKQALPPEAVAKAIAHALTATRPKTRYVVGTDARVQALLARFLPDRIRDTLLLWFLNYPRAAPSGGNG